MRPGSLATLMRRPGRKADGLSKARGDDSLAAVCYRRIERDLLVRTLFPFVGEAARFSAMDPSLQHESDRGVYRQPTNHLGPA